MRSSARSSARSGVRLAAAAVVLAGVVTTAGPASAAAGCAPKIQVLGSLGTSAYDPGNPQTEGVLALGAGRLSVGVSGARPVFWTGATLHRVPLPTADARGELVAANKGGLMVGRVLGADGYVFTYRAGAPAITRLPGSDYAYGDADVNDAGYVVSRDGTGVGLVWKDGLKARELPLPGDAGPGTRLDLVTAVNNKGDVLGMARQDYEDPETGAHHQGTYPVIWPGDGGPAKALAPTAQESHVQDLDEAGRVVGYDWYGPGYRFTPWTWAPPYSAPGTSPGVLNTHPYGTFEAIGPNSGVSVGTARFHPEEQAVPDQAQLWPGTGPVLALPRLSPNRASTAASVADDGRVGGAAINAKGTLKPVIWTCATRQAYLPQP
ncbi:hypothetical protein AB0P15_11740 [Streptomyces sp. NPDC087917]|uniref:hypothetical protein n=1 Tax=Streptomyces sp. NPDC087917 TaxID=3155060 RepID=UPI003434A2DF